MALALTRRMRALAVAESAGVRRILRDALREAAFQVVEAEGAEGALKALAELGPFELGLIDWTSGPGGGLDLARRIRAERDFDSMRLMMVIPELRVESMLEALKAGVDEYMVKPFTRATLLDKLAALGLGAAR